MSEKERAGLADRLGSDLLEKRLAVEGESMFWSDKDQARRRKLTRRRLAGWLTARTLGLTGLYGRGLANAGRPEVRTNHVRLAGLDPEAKPLRLLQLSDLHLEARPELLATIADIIAGLDYDLAVITGDISDTAPGPALLEEIKGLPEMLKAPLGALAILGNHDSIAMVPFLEARGIRFLLNENVVIAHGQSRLGIAGVDDSRRYKTSDLKKSLAFADGPDAVILLSHSPDLSDLASQSGVDLYLCGHTHAGQICLAPGRPVFTRTSAPRSRASGPWRAGSMQGYTSAGTGSSYPAVRLNCRPEITLHIIK